MAVQKRFIDWKRPFLPEVVRQLISMAGSGPVKDFSGLLVVFPGSRAGHRFLELLTMAAGGQICPPEIITVGQLPEQLYQPKRPFATAFTQRLAWARVLREQPAETIQALMRRPPEADDLDGWLRLGELLRRQHAELAGDCLNFADVCHQAQSLEGFDEGPRWQVLADIQESYLRFLDQLELWDQQTARLKSIEFEECRTDRDIITIGTVDLNRTLRSMLDLVDDRVTTFIHAPETWSHRFDKHGCLIPAEWQDVHVAISPEQVRMVPDAESQGAAVVESLMALNGDYGVNEVTLTVPDEALVPLLERTLQRFDVPAFWPIDRPVRETGPFRLLDAIAEYLRAPQTARLAALIRHPDMSAWLDEQNLPFDWLSCWDRYFSEHLQRDVAPVADGGYFADVAVRLVSRLKQLLRPLMKRAAPLSKWAEPMRDLLVALYGRRTICLDDPEQARLAESCERFFQACDAHHELPGELDPVVSAADAIQLTLEDSDGDLYRTSDEPAVRLSGWLDLPLDDAPVAIVTSFNEGNIPSSMNHDLFLPNRLRAHLGIEDNDRRYARDLHGVLCVLKSRQHVQFLVPRRSFDGDPLSPSRFLFATDSEQIAERVLAFYDSKRHCDGMTVPLSVAHQPGDKSRFEIPRPTARQWTPLMLRVTDFRAYLASPYRYYLSHVLRLKDVSDQIDELDSAAFGTLMHFVLERFGSSEARHATQEPEIAAFLEQELQQAVADCFGDSPLATVLIQVGQASRRLRAFARWQAAWRREGWEIRTVESCGLPPVPFDLGNGRMIFLKGRIDRIDFHPGRNEWAVFDYKTGDAGKTPDESHRQKEDWVDLQLPLYRHLAATAGVGSSPHLGYILLPRDTDDVREAFAPWSAEELAGADDTARRIANCILDEEFWCERDAPPPYATDFDAICQVGVFGQKVTL